MLAPEPVIRYCPLEALNSVVPLLEGSPTSPELVKAHLKLDDQVMAALHKEKFPIVPG